MPLDKYQCYIYVMNINVQLYVFTGYFKDKQLLAATAVKDELLYVQQCNPN